MLGKVISYEFKATSKLFALIYAALIILSLITKLFLSINITENEYSFIFSSLISIFMILYILTILAVSILTFVFIIFRFYKTMTRDQAYLTFSLPVKVSTILNGKILVSAIWTIISFIVVIISLVIIFSGLYIPREITSNIENLVRVINREFFITKTDTTLFIINIFISNIISVFYSLLLTFTAIALAQLMNKNRVLWTVVFYFAIYFCLQTVSSISFSILSVFIRSSYNEAAIVFANQFFLVVNLLLAISTGIFYYLTYYIFSHKLNLE
jgi:hypothetical protein